MRWGLVITLALPGLGIGLAVDYGLSEVPMMVLWAALRLVSAVWIARSLVARHLANGFFAGFLGAGSAVLSGVVLFDPYTTHHPEFLQNAGEMAPDMDPRTLLALIAPAVGFVHGVVQGVLAWIAGRIVAPRPVA